MLKRLSLTIIGIGSKLIALLILLSGAIAVKSVHAMNLNIKEVSGQKVFTLPTSLQVVNNSKIDLQLKTPTGDINIPTGSTKAIQITDLWVPINVYSYNGEIRLKFLDSSNNNLFATLRLRLIPHKFSGEFVKGDYESYKVGQFSYNFGENSIKEVTKSFSSDEKGLTLDAELTIGENPASSTLVLDVLQKQKLI